MDPLCKLELNDLEVLLALEPERALGRIVELNSGQRYHNTLNVIELLVRLREMREHKMRVSSSNGDRRVA